jgi:hypothetical protein
LSFMAAMEVRIHILDGKSPILLPTLGRRLGLETDALPRQCVVVYWKQMCVAYTDDSLSTA